MPFKPSFDFLEDRLVPAVINVISTADNTLPVITAGHAGTAADPFQAPSLRSAISFTNANPGGNTINLAVTGDYKITIPGAGEDNNATGDFDILPAGGNLTIQNTSGGTAIVDGNHLDRVFDINPANTDNPATKILVTFDGFTIQNGVAQVGDAAAGSGGGIRDQGNTSLTLTDMTIIANSATADGGGVAMENAPGSTPWKLTVNNSTISGNHAGDAGGGIETDGAGTVNINNGTVITGNSSVNQGAGIWLDAIADGVASVTINTPGTGYTTAPNVTFSAPQNAGGRTATGTAMITGGMVIGVTIVDPGSGYTAAPNVTFSAPGTGTTATGTATLGFNNSANLNITGATISNNSALSNTTGIGGGVGNAGNGVVTITDSMITGNFAGASGGGFGDENAAGTLNVTNTVFANNTAVTTGGGVSVASPTTTISNSTFRANAGGTGGGIFADVDTTLLLSSDYLVQNTSVSGAGGIQALGTLTSIRDSELRDNTTAANGGGLFASGMTLFVNRTTFADNAAAGSGGGLEIETTGTGADASFITDTTINGNRALNNVLMGSIGGGVDFGNGGNFTGTLTMINDTVTGNYAFSGGGLAIAHGGTANVENTIVAGNFVGDQGPDYVGTNGQVFTSLGGNLIGIKDSGMFNQATDQSGTAASPLDAMLSQLQNNGGPTVGADADSITLTTKIPLTGSPAKNKGVTTGVPGVDERGFLRPLFLNATTIDVGAVESLGVPLTTTSTVPGNGDTNPYGVVFVPSNFPSTGVLQPGDLLVANFNNADGVQGTGTTITRITPAGQTSTFFTSTLPGLSDALGILSAGFVIVGNVPTNNGAVGAGSLQILDKNGNVVSVNGLNGTLITDPWSLTVNDQGTTAQVFVSNASGTTGTNGTVVRIDLKIQNGTITVMDEIQVGSGYNTRPDPAAFVLGPAGLVYDAAHDILYVASQADNEIFKITGAGTTATALNGTGTVVFNDQTHLHGPLGLVLLPNGNLLTANSDAQNADPNQPSELVQFTTAGQFVGQWSVDPANGGAFGVTVATVNGQLRFATVDDNANTVLTLMPPTPTITPVTPNPTSTAVNAIDIVFSQAVSGLTLGDLTLTGTGGTNLLTGSQTLTSNDGIHWTLGNLAGLTSPTHRVAKFTLTVNGNGVTDGVGNSVQGSTSMSFTEIDPALMLDGMTLTVPGTAGNDTFTFTTGPNEQVTLNGVTYAVDPTVVNTILFQGNGGTDSAILNAAGTGNTATLALGSGTLSGNGYKVSVSGVTTLNVTTTPGGTDTATISDSTGGNTLYGRSTYTLLTNGTVGTLAEGFQSVVVTQTGGNPDAADFFSTTGKSTFVATPAYSHITTQGVFIEAVGFKTSVATNSGGTAAAYLYDSPGNDTFVGTPTYAYLSGAGVFNEAIGFQNVLASSTMGGNDAAYLFGASTGSNTFVSAPTYAYLNGGGVLNEAVGFHSVVAQSNSSTDTAYLSAAPGVSTFVGTSGYSYFSTPSGFNEAVGFHSVFASGVGSTAASAFLFASTTNDTFHGLGNTGTLTGAGYVITVDAFAAVYAYATAGGNHLTLGAVTYLFTPVGNWIS
jgi:hypothetical protein